MIELGGNNYKLCLVDTCVISELLKNKETIGKRIINKLINGEIIYIFCYSVLTMSELRKNKNIYDEFFEYTQILPSAIIKSYVQLVEDELKSFPKYNNADRLLYFFPLLNEQKILKEKKAVFENPRVIEEMNIFDNGRQSVLDAWSEYTKYYKSGDKGFTKRAIENWVLAVTLKQLIFHNKNFSN